MSETKIQDDLIEKIMKIEDPFIRESNKLREAQKRGNRKKEPEYQFQKGHIRDSTALAEQVMKMGLSIEDIKREIESKRGKNEFWRTNQLLDDIPEKHLEEAKKRLAFMKSTQSRLGKDSLVKLRESNLIESILSKDNPKSGAKKKKKKKKKKKFTEKKKPSKKSEHKKKKTQEGGYPFWFDDVPKGMSRAQYERLEKSKPKNKSMKVWIREEKKKKKKKNTKKKKKS